MRQWETVVRNIMENLTLNNIVAIVSIVGTFLSSVIAVFTLTEVMKQRRAMYRPKIFLNEFLLTVQGNPMVPEKKFYYFKLHNLYEPENKQVVEKESILAQFFFENIGYGIASKIRYEWQFDYLLAVKKISALSENIATHIDHKDKSIIITLNGTYYSSYRFNDIEKEKKIDFIKPESLQKNTKPTTIPMIITSIHMDYIMLKNKILSKECKFFQEEDFDGFPKASLQIQYEDIAEKPYYSTYNFKIKGSNSFHQIDHEKIDTTKDFAFLSFYLNG